MPSRVRVCFLVSVFALFSLGSFAHDSSEPESLVEALNSNIKEAVVEGRKWPNWPGGVAGILFGFDSYVLPAEEDKRSARRNTFCANIIFLENPKLRIPAEKWYEANIRKTSDGSWRVEKIEPCTSSRAEEAKSKIEYFRNLGKTKHGFDYYTQGPLDLLDLLVSLEHPSWCAPVIPAGWVKESDIPALIKLLDSEERCANVVNFLSSFRDDSWSTVGNEAAYLIWGFREDRYPPGLNSTRHGWEVMEIKRWWSEKSGT